MQRKLLVLLIVVLLLTIVFSGCSEKNNNASNGPNNNTSNVESKTQHGSLEVEASDKNYGLVSNAEVWLWTQENFSSNPNWNDYTKTTAIGNTNLTGKIIFSNLDVGEYVVSLSIRYFTNGEEALAHAKHVNIAANQVSYELLQKENLISLNESIEQGHIRMNQIYKEQYGITQEMAEEVLASGTKIIDSINDWISTGNSWDNPSFYPIDFADLKEVDMGIDNKFLYVKAIFNGVWPNMTEDWPSFNGDQVEVVGYCLFIDTDNNHSTGSLANGGSEIATGGGAKKELGIAVTNNYCTNPSGIEDPEEKRYLNNYIDAVWFGGPGYNYVINVYPLNNLNISKGMEVTTIIWVETNSENFGHSSFDILGTPVLCHGCDPLMAYTPIILGENKTIS